MDENFKEKKLNSNDPGVMAAMMWAYENDKFDKEFVNAFIAGYDCNRFGNMTDLLGIAIKMISACQDKLSQLSNPASGNVGMDYEMLSNAMSSANDMKIYLEKCISIANTLRI